MTLSDDQGNKYELVPYKFKNDDAIYYLLKRLTQRIAADDNTSSDTLKNAKTALLTLLRTTSDAANQKTVAIVKNELRHIVEGDEDGVVYSLEAIGRRAKDRLAQLTKEEK